MVRVVSTTRKSKKRKRNTRDLDIERPIVGVLVWRSL
jgi:hypothetical protein